MNTLTSKLSNFSYTENGALTNKSSGSVLLDFFAQGAALRTATNERIIDLFSKALNENALLALKTLFYIRDVRGGQGERRVFRVVIKWLAEHYPQFVIANLDNIVNFGRWDDLLALEGTQVEVDALTMFAQQLLKDSANIGSVDEGAKISLAGKWAPSENASSKETKRLAKVVRGYLDLDSKAYRQLLTGLRSQIAIVEQKMCANKWDNINYSHVPSRAGLLYRKAFSKHDADRYVSYLADVKSGKAKINASVLYPYDIVKEIMGVGMQKIGSKYFAATKNNVEADALDALWNALPNYLEGNSHNGLVVCDVSGSMTGLPICVAISLAVYFGERVEGQFKDFFITFSQKPEFVKIIGNNIVEKVNNISRANWGMSTNIQGTFDLVLETGVKNNVPKEEMPDTIYIVSDMEFDAASGRNTTTNFEEIRKKYEAAGYQVPQLVFWNVNSRNTQSPITMDEAKNAKLVSGCSPEILTNLLKGHEMTAYDLFLSKVNSDRYQSVVV